ncbi:hypothetical protein CC78DRAFT_149745 [Lojkania enalia]|uniref:Uncharacterized protein n=1 Tax=Lojkania enalia TaxID=147567 RepID=A0A9P4N5T5_9PLEO|nr:hypothetical protein CC78DRAFT_149745 [Didymosphaeria enalia]
MKESFKNRTNQFELLSNLIEQEPDFGEISFQCSTTSTELPPSSAIADDPLEDVMPLHAYVLENEDIISVVHHISEIAAEDEIPLAFAGWLHNFAYRIIQLICAECHPYFGNHIKLADEYLVRKDMELKRLLGDREEFQISTRDFNDCSNGDGLIWPCYVFESFRNSPRDDCEFMDLVDRQPIAKFFSLPPEEAQARKEILKASKDRVTSRGSDDT